MPKHYYAATRQNETSFDDGSVAIFLGKHAGPSAALLAHDLPAGCMIHELGTRKKEAETEFQRLRRDAGRQINKRNRCTTPEAETALVVRLLQRIYVALQAQASLLEPLDRIWGAEDFCKWSIESFLSKRLQAETAARVLETVARRLDAHEKGDAPTSLLGVARLYVDVGTEGPEFWGTGNLHDQGRALIETCFRNSELARVVAYVLETLQDGPSRWNGPGPSLFYQLSCQHAFNTLRVHEITQMGLRYYLQQVHNRNLQREELGLPRLPVPASLDRWTTSNLEI